MNRRISQSVKECFLWLDAHPGSYWWIAALGTGLLVVQGFVLLARENEREGGKVAVPAWRDLSALFCFILSWRWPFLFAAAEYNPDESQLIAGGITLAHDPVFWRSVDGTTSGPLNFYLLVPYAWLGIPLDYFTARLTGLMLITGALFAVYRTLAVHYRCSIAWLAIFPAAAFFATATYSDLIHYSSEHLGFFLTALSIWLIGSGKPADSRRMRWGCFVAGATPWAKLQMAPIAVTLIGWGLWEVYQQSRIGARRPDWRGFCTVLLASAAPTIIALLLIALTGQLEAAWRRYFVHNLIYVGSARDPATLKQVLHAMGALAAKDGRVPIFLTVSGALLVLASHSYLRRKCIPSRLCLVGIALTLAAAFSVLSPRREFLHYTLLLPVPLTFLVGASAGDWCANLSTKRARIILSLVFAFVGLGPLLLTRVKQPVAEIYGGFAYNWTHPRTGVSVLVHSLAGKAGSVGVWGWANNIYVETGLPQATRDAHSVWSIKPNEQRSYHRSAYLADLRSHRPAVFVDAVGPGSFAYEQRETQAHEIFPELAVYLQQNYLLVSDLGEARVYARNDLTTARELTPARLGLLLAQGRLTSVERNNPIPPPSSSIDGFQRKNIGQREVLMLLPPAQVEWELENDVRAVSLEFGFDPVAFEQGQSNGADLFLDVVDAEGTRPVFQTFLNPAREPDDRAPHRVLVVLPDLRKPSRVILRTAPGPYGDTAWDWVYVSNLKLIHSPHPLTSAKLEMR